MRKTSFCQIGNHIHENMPPKPQVRFHYATFTLQDNFRDLTSETIYLIISRICHTQLSSFNESSETKTNMQLIHSHIVKYAFSLQQRECLRIFVTKIATYFSTNKFTCYFLLDGMIFQIMGKKRGDMERATRSEQKEGRPKRDRGGFPENIDMSSTRGRE